MAYLGQRTFVSYEKKASGWGKVFDEEQDIYTDIWSGETKEGFTHNTKSTEDDLSENDELDKALEKIRKYLESKNGVIHSIDELPLESTFIHLRLRIYTNLQTYGYFDVLSKSSGNKVSSRISEVEYDFDKPVNQDKVVTVSNDLGVKFEIYLTDIKLLPTVNIVYKKPETLANELFLAFDGMGTDEEKAIAALRTIGTINSERYKNVNNAYLKLYGAIRNRKSIINDTIYEMIDSPDKLKKAFKLLEYDAKNKVLRWMKEKRYDTDSLAYAMRDQDMKGFSVDERYKLIEYVATGTVGNNDEETIIRLITNLPITDIKLFFKKLTTDDGELLKRLESKINFSEYSQYHQQLHLLYQLQFFHDNSTKEVADQLENPKKLFAYRNPSAISGMFKVRNYIDEVEIKNGKINFRYWNLGPGFGYHNYYSFGLFEPVTILFMDNEPTFNAKAGERVMMPAINLFALEDAQTMREGRLAVDIALILSGTGGIFSAASKAGKIWAGVEVLMGAADITINELRPQIAENDSGREFLKYWDIASTLITVYGIGRVAMQLPHIFRKLGDSYHSYKNVSKLGKNKLGKVDELMDELRLSVQKAKDEARTKINNPANKAHINARKEAWTKYSSKNPDAKFGEYKKKYDILAINRESGVLSEKEFQQLMGGRQSPSGLSLAVKKY